MADKKKNAHHRSSRLYYRLTTAVIMLVLLGGLAAVGWFSWTTVNDVLNHNDGSENIKVQGVDTESMTSLEQHDQDRRQGVNGLPALERDPFIIKGGPAAAVGAAAAVTTPATVAAPVKPLPEPEPVLTPISPIN